MLLGRIYEGLREINMVRTPCMISFCSPDSECVGASDPAVLADHLGRLLATLVYAADTLKYNIDYKHPMIF